MKTNTKPATLINIAYFLMLTIWALGFSTAYFYDESHALSAEYTIKLCEGTAYWVNYVESRKKTCDIIWQKISYDTLKTFE